MRTPERRDDRKKLVRKLIVATVDRDVRGADGASDHAPVVIELKG